jgi:nucleotide-binding universal stress UspA family protein
LLDQAQHLRRAGLAVEVDVRFGSPSACIAEVAAILPNALIAMATHGYNGLRRWTQGSVADQVLQRVRVPLLLVRGSTQATVATPTLKRILVPWDGSTLARAALPYAATLARAAGAEVILEQAVAALAVAAGERHQQRRRGLAALDGLAAIHAQAVNDTEALAAELRREGVAATAAVEAGDAPAVIAAAAARYNADLIVMATHGYGGLRRLAVGSVADSVLHLTPTPILLVPVRGQQQ